MRPTGSSTPRIHLDQLNPSTFADFVHRVLDREYPGLKRFGDHKDGGIDLLWEDADRRVFFQCKFLGATNSTPLKAWESEKAGLDASLQIAADGRLVGQNQYRPWLDAKSPITYVFCHSKRAKHVADLDRLREHDPHLRGKIEHFFHKRISQRQGFSHLSTLNVVVLSGERLIELCNDQPKVRFDFFGPELPGGVTRIDGHLRKSEAKDFADYLQGDHLPYFSRREFNEGVSENQRIQDEGSLVERLFSLPDDEPVLLITGPGGFGKTRLTLELCQLSEQTRQCVSFRLEDEATADGITELCLRMPPQLDLIFWIDYIETSDHFEEIVKRAIKHNLAGEAIIRIIANCRVSYYKSELVDIYDAVVNLESYDAKDRVDQYRVEVFFHILYRAGFRRSDRMGTECGHNPVLAAFILYIAERERDRPGYLPDLRLLVEDPTYHADIGNWLVKRLHRSILALHENISLGQVASKVGQVVALLPISDDTLIQLAGSELGAYLDVLLHDHLVERREETWRTKVSPVKWVAVHDVIVDYLLVRCIGSAALPELAADQLFGFAERYCQIHRVVINLQRIADNDALAGVDWGQFFTRKLRGASPAWLLARRSLLGTSLLGPDNRIRMVALDLSLWSDMAASPESAHIATLAASYAAWRKRSEGAADHELDNILVPLLEVACNQEVTSYKLLKQALVYNPQKFRAKALDTIQASTASDLSNLVTSWIEAGLEPDAIRDKASTYFAEPGSLKVEPLFLRWITAALRSMGATQMQRELSFLAPHMQRWISEAGNHLRIGAFSVYRAWLMAAERAGREYCFRALSFLEPKMREWLVHHGTKRQATFVFHGWLRAASKCDGKRARSALSELVDYMEQWLGTEGRSRDAQARFIYSAWLQASSHTSEDATTALEYLYDYLARWLEHSDYGGDDTQYLFHDWLWTAAKADGAAAKKALDLLKAPMLGWLNRGRNSTERSASFIYAGWLRAAIAAGPVQRNDAITLIGKYVELWITKHKEASFCSYVRGPWRRVSMMSGREVGARSGQNEWLDEWWMFSNNLDRFDTEDELSAAVEELSALVEEFPVPLELSERSRHQTLKDLLIPTRFLGRFDEFIPPLCELFRRCARHPTLFNSIEDCNAKASVSHLKIISGILADSIESGYQASSEPRAINRVLRFLIDIPPVGDEIEAIKRELRELQFRYPVADLWQGIVLLDHEQAGV